MSLGILPLLAIGAGAAIVGGGAWLWNERDDYNQWKGDVRAPKQPRAPAAPQTAQEMLAWTPEQAQRQDRANYAAWIPTAIPAPPRRPGENDALIAAAAVAAIAGVMLLRSN